MARLLTTRSRATAAIWTAASLAGCTAVIGDDMSAGSSTGGSGQFEDPMKGTGGSAGLGGASTGAGGTTVVEPKASSCTPASPIAGRSPLRRLTRTEYDNTVRDLLNDTSRPASSFPPEEETKGFLNNADVFTTTDLHVENWMNAAEQIAASARAKGTFDLACSKDTQKCAKDFIRSFGLKALRRPLEDDEVATYYSRFQLGASGGFAEGLEWVVGRMLQSPSFLYRLELDASAAPAGQPVKLSGYSLATRLSYFLWQTMPDDLLLMSAANGTLGATEGVQADVERMMKAPHFGETLTSFHDQWIGLSEVLDQQKANPLTPAWNSDLQLDLLTEADLFIKDVYNNGRSAKDLLTGQFSYISPLLATFYGVKHPTGSGFQRVDQLPHRYGLLTMPAILASNLTPSKLRLSSEGGSYASRLSAEACRTRRQTSKS